MDPTIDVDFQKPAFWTRPRGYKTFFLLNSADHNIYPANNSQITNNFKLFLAKHSWARKFPC